MRSSSSRATPTSRPASSRKGPGSGGPAAKGGPASGNGALDQASVVRLQQSLGNQGVADMLADGGRDARPGASQRLDAETQSEMEGKLGADLSDVEIFADQKASSAARGRGAEAFTQGNSIVFDSGAYDPQSDRGKDLLTHELAHVIQQREGAAHGASSDQGTARRAEAEAEGSVSDARKELKERVPAGAVQAKESPLANTEMSDDASAMLEKIKDATGDKWSDFENWWKDHRDSALAINEANADGGEESSRLTQQLDMDLKEVLEKAGSALSGVAGRLREDDPAAAAQLNYASGMCRGGHYLADTDYHGVQKMLHTIRLFYTFQRIKEAAEDLTKVDVAANQAGAAVALDGVFVAVGQLGEDVQGGLVDQMMMLGDINRGGGLLPSAGGIVTIPKELYRRLGEAFKELNEMS